jgi:enoyl-CoA hydratase/carnithine racemase
VNGPAVGLGATLMTLCDIVYIAETTFVADPHVASALVAGDGGAVTWPALTSLLRAKQYLLTGDRIPAAEAHAMGLANFVVPADRVVDEAVAFAHRLASLPPQQVQDTKAVLNQVLRTNAVAALGYGLAAESQSHDTPEYAAMPELFRSRKK